MLFIFIVSITYLLYAKDIQILNGIMEQQKKVAKNFYVILIQYFNIPNLNVYINAVFLGLFINIYFFACLRVLYKPKIKVDFSYTIRKVASPHVHFASQICTAQGNLTLLYSKNLSIFTIQ